MQSHINRRAILAGAVSLPAMSIPTIAAATQVAEGPAGPKGDPGPMGPPGRVGGTFSAGVEAKNVMDYGAKGNGIVDDIAAFEAALKASRGNVYGLLRIPVGQYKISRPIDLDKLKGRVGVRFVGDCSNSDKFGATGSGSNIVPTYGNDYIVKSSAGGFAQLAFENLGFISGGASGGIFFRGGGFFASNCFFTGRGIASPEAWNSVIQNCFFRGGTPLSGNDQHFAISLAGCNNVALSSIDCDSYNKALVFSGLGVSLTSFRIEVSRHAIVLGEDSWGTQFNNFNLLKHFTIRNGTLEGNTRGVWVRNANFGHIGGFVAQGHESWFGDGISQAGVWIDNANNVEFQGISANGGFSDSALVVTNPIWATRFNECEFKNVLGLAPGNYLAGSTVLKFKRGVDTAMPVWLKRGMIAFDFWGNGVATGQNNTVAAIGPDSITLSQPLAQAMSALPDSGSGIAFLTNDGRRAPVGGARLASSNGINFGNSNIEMG
jgi:hypothetical protein